MSSPLLKSEKNYEMKFVDSGAFGAVFKITDKKDRSVYALKQINLKKIPPSERQAALADAQKEYKILKRGIPNVLRSYGSHYDESEMVFKFSTALMEMNLTNFIEKNGALSFENFIPIFSDILSGKFPFVLNFKIHSDIFH
jgi:serine/threonine protein kinase